MDNCKRVNFDTKNYWDLGGETTVYSEVSEKTPYSGKESTVRITLSNLYWPADGMEIFVRTGDLITPTAPDDLNSASDWLKADLIEEIVSPDDEEIFRADAEEPFEDETPWHGTFEAKTILSQGKNSIEIKLLSASEMIQSQVLTGWFEEAK